MSDWPETNESLILRMKDPVDATAWTAFLKVYRPVVYRMARGRGLQHADAEDLTQQVFLSVAGAIDRWHPNRDQPPFGVWLTRIARNAIVNAVTRSAKDKATGGSSAADMLSEIVDRNGGTTRELIRVAQTQAMQWAASNIKNELSERL